MTKGVVPALPSNPSPNGTDVTADMLQQLSSCWKPAFFNPCKGCLAIPEGYFRGGGNNNPNNRFKKFFRSTPGIILTVLLALLFFYLLLKMVRARGPARAHRFGKL